MIAERVQLLAQSGQILAVFLLVGKLPERFDKLEHLVLVLLHDVRRKGLLRFRRDLFQTVFEILCRFLFQFEHQRLDILDRLGRRLKGMVVSRLELEMLVLELIEFLAVCGQFRRFCGIVRGDRLDHRFAHQFEGGVEILSVLLLSRLAF